VSFVPLVGADAWPAPDAAQSDGAVPQRIQETSP